MSVPTNPHRAFLFNDYKDESYLPYLYRWLYRDHVTDSIAQFGPYCTSYSTYRALPMPPDGEDYGTYRWIMTEHHYLLDPDDYAGEDGVVHAFGEVWDEEFLEATNQPRGNDLRDRTWRGSRDGYHPIVIGRAPLFWERDLKGRGRTVNDGPNYRWMIVFKYPEGVSADEGDDWFLNQLAPQLVALPQLNRFLTSRCRISKTGPNSPWVRLAELWFDDSNAWHDAIVKNADKFVKPKWAKWDKFPYLEPYVDFTGEFLLDMPEQDFLRQFRGYYTTR